MQTSRRLDIPPPKTLVERGKFKVDEYKFSYEQGDGSKRQQTRLVFERGAAAAVLVLNTDTDSVVLVEQFRLPTLVARRRGNQPAMNGRLTEAIAGMIDGDESPEETIIRETKEETGYQIRNPKPICTFFASPGGSSERIFLYFARVTNADRKGRGGGDGDEDITVVEWPISDLFRRLEKGEIEDPKLAIAAYWLQQHEKEPLGTATVRFQFKEKPDLIIGYKTGQVDDVKGIDIWVNSENTDMTMDRFIGRSVSARIRYLGAKKDKDTVFEDTIQDALRAAIGPRGFVRIGKVLVTKSGMLLNSHQVERIFHVATVEGLPGPGIHGDPNRLNDCVQAVLQKVDEENGKFWKSKLKSILFPMLGAGDGGLSITEVVERIIPAAVEHLQKAAQPTIREVYFLAFKRLDRCACEEVFKRYCADGTLVRLP
jgi:nudix-type nucleoside diphosphatase (YffH/AdpP family)